VVIHPETKQFYVFRSGSFQPYKPLSEVKVAHDIDELVEGHTENIHVHLIG
jgi:hypothetical protein